MILVHKTPFEGAANLYSQGWLLPQKPDGSYGGDSPVSLAKLITRYVWSPHLWNEGKRAEKQWQGCAWLVLDFDAGKTLWEAMAEFSAYQHVIGTTKSHGKLKNGVVCDRFRVCLRLTEACTDLQSYKRSASKVVAGTGADKACVDGARIFFPCVTIESICTDGLTYTLPTVLPYTPPPAGYPQGRKLAGLALGGIYQPGTRNKDCFYFACRFAERGAAIDETISLIQSKTDLPASEVERTVRQAYIHVQRGGNAVRHRNHNQK